ncbi:MAG TPA: circadian clock KaiB family protein, partial [Verrucomicrobiae bacterium]|nr:circadian clock KaiB family protein [Verrucomicrobiae bacterium]
MSSPKKSAKSGKKDVAVDSGAVFEKLLKRADALQQYQLRLYVTGTTPRSSRAIANIRALCEEYLAGHYELEVIDIYQQPDQAVKEQIIAAPTLVKHLPIPLKRFV